MPDKNDLSAYKTGIIADNKGVTGGKKKKRGQPPKPQSEKKSSMLQIRITEEQRKKIEEKAGVASVSAYVRHYLETETDIFK